MNIIDGGGRKISGAKAGDKIHVVCTDGTILHLIYSSRDRDGIEGFNCSLRDNPLTFIPFAVILRVTKDTTIG